MYAINTCTVDTETIPATIAMHLLTPQKLPVPS